MRRLRDLDIHPYTSTYGARIAADAEPEPVGSILPAATDQLRAWAAAYWPEADPDEFEWEGMTARNRESGVVYEIRVGMPVVGEIASGVGVFCVRDGRIVLLADKPDRLLANVWSATYSMFARKVVDVGRPRRERGSDERPGGHHPRPVPLDRADAGGRRLGTSAEPAPLTASTRGPRAGSGARPVCPQGLRGRPRQGRAG
jgi:hypothetical protein